MMKILSNLKIYFLLIMIKVYLTQDICNTIINPTAYKECSAYSNNKTDTICCFISGVYGGNNGTSCLSVDSLFSGKTVPFTINEITSTMICGDQTSSAKVFIFNSMIFVFILLLIV